MSDQLELMFRSHVENCLKTLLGTHELGDGPCEHLVERDGVEAWVGVRGRYLQVHAIAAEGLRRNASLLTEINDLNSSSWWTRTYWISGRVVVEATMPWPMVDLESLEFTLGEVTGTAARIGPMVGAVHGGASVQPAGAA